MIKRIMVCKVDIGSLLSEDVNQYMKEVIEKMKDKSVYDQQYFIPIRQGESKIIFITINEQNGKIYTSQNSEQLELSDKDLEYVKKFSNIKK